MPDYLCQPGRSTVANVDLDGNHGDPTIDSVDTDCLDDGERSVDDPSGECDDVNALINPGVMGVCDGIDDNCDGSTDGADAVDAITWSADANDDGYTNPDDTAGDGGNKATGCGCASGGNPAQTGAAVLLAGVALMVGRRRRAG